MTSVAAPRTAPLSLCLFALVATLACGGVEPVTTEGGASEADGSASSEGAGSTSGEATTDASATTGASATTEGPGATTGAVEPPDLLGDPLLNIAHRGGAGEFPEHTLVAYQGSLDVGAHVLELDVHRALDDALVVMHDDTVERTTDGEGAIVDMTLAELKQLDAAYDFTTDGGESFPYRGQGINVPTVDEVLTAFPDALYVIEIKPNDASLIDPLLAALEQHGARARVVLASFNDGVMSELRATAPDVHTAMTIAEVVEFISLTPETTGGYEAPARFLQVPIGYPGIDVITPERVALADQLGLKIHAWTINDAAEMQLLQGWGVHGVMTDYPSRLDAVLNP